MKHNMNSRLLAWLLTLVMVLNIFPVSALAGEEPEIEIEKSPSLKSEDVTPGEDQYVVRYMMDASTTYDNKPFRLANDRISDWTLATFNQKTNNGNSLAEAFNHETQFAPSVAGASVSDYDWKETQRVFTLIYKASDAADVYVYYYGIYKKGTQEVIETFNYLHDGEAGLKFNNPDTDTLDLRNLIKGINNNHPGNQINIGKGYKAIPFNLDPKYINLPKTITSEQGVKFNVKYYGYTVSENQNAATSRDAINTSSIVSWKGERGGIRLYYLIEEAKTEYTIEWKNDDGTVLKTDTVAEGETPSYGDAPTKNSDDNYEYIFKGWDPEVTAATANTSYTAVFEKKAKPQQPLYNLAKINNTWYRLQKTSITILTNKTATDYVNENNVNDGKQTRINATDYRVEDYDFENQIITLDGVDYYFQGNLTTDQLDPQKNYYTYQYEYDNKVSDVQVIVAGKNKIGGADDQGNVRWAITENRYGGSNWIDCFKRNYIITLNKKENRSYTIKFIGADNKTLKTQTCKFGITPTPPNTPTKGSTTQYSYKFIGWDKEIVPAAGNATYTALFEEKPREYTITWKDDKGQTIDTTRVAYGETPTHANPTKDSDEKYSYSFREWTPAIVQVTGNATYKAQFDKEVIGAIEQDLYNFLKIGDIREDYYRLKKQTIKGAPVDSVPDGKVKTEDYPYTIPSGEYNFENVKFTYNGDTYKYSKDPIDDYYFEVKPLGVEVWDYLHGKDGTQKHTDWLNNPDGWVDGKPGDWGEIDNQTRAYHRNYEAILHTPTTARYTVTYVYEGNVPAGLKPPAEAKYAEGEDVTIAAAPVAVEGYTFSGWKHGTETVVAGSTYKMPANDVEITGSFSANTDTAYVVKYYLQNIEDDDYSENTEAQVNGTGTTEAKATAEVKEFEGFTFNKDASTLEGEIAGDGSLVLNVYYNRDVHSVSYTLDGAAYGETKEYKYGAEIPAAAAPTEREGYTFSGWKGEQTTMGTADVAVTGTFTVNSYGYTIHHYLKGTTQKAADDETGEADYGSTVKATIATELDELALTVDDPTAARELQIGANVNNNVLTIYYTLALDIKAEKLSESYSGQPLYGQYTVTGALSDDAETIKNALGTAPSITNVKESVLDYLTEEEQAEITGIPSYYVTSFTPGTLEIKPAKMIDLTVTGYDNQYDGQSHGVTVSGQPEGSTITYIYTNKDGEDVTSETTPTVKDVADGTVIIKVVVTNDNYETEMRDVKLNVQKREASIVVDEGQGMTYGDKEEPELKATVKNVVDGETLNYTLSRKEGTDAGEYDIIVTLEQNPNYEIKTTGNIFTISKKEVTLRAAAAEKPWGADDPELTAEFDGVLEAEEDAIKYTVKRNAGEYAVDNQEAAISGEGLYTYYNEFPIIVEVTNEPQNYNVTPEGSTFKIIKTPVTIYSPLDQLNEGETVYSGMIVTLKAEMAGLDKYPDNYAYQWQISDEKDGPYDVIEGATGRTYSYVLNNNTSGKFYRVVVTLTQNVNKKTK